MDYHDVETRSAGRQQRHTQLSDVIWRGLIKTKIQAAEEPNGLTRIDGRRPDGVTLIPWSRGRCLTWDFTIRDTLAASHLDRTSLAAGAAAQRLIKYADIMHIATTLF